MRDPRSSADQFHDVKKACCATIESLAAGVVDASGGGGGVSEDDLSKHAVKMLKAVLPNCGHRHSQVRLASLAAASALFAATPPGAVAEAGYRRHSHPLFHFFTFCFFRFSLFRNVLFTRRHSTLDIDPSLDDVNV